MPTNDEKSHAYDKYLQDSFSSKNCSLFIKLCEHLVREETPLLISRPLLLKAVKEYWPSNPFNLQTGSEVIDLLKVRLVSFEDVDASLRQTCAALAIEEEEYIEAAKLLSGIQVDSSKVGMTNIEKVELYVKCAELYLQEDETVTAETMLNRATRDSHLLTEEQWSLKLRHLVCYARILDAKRKFLEAADRYYELSLSNPTKVDPEDLLKLLEKAVTCAILSLAGPARSKLLATLYKDERVKSNAESCHAVILGKMVRQQLLRKPEVATFEESLMPHQKAILGNGFTVLEHAVLEHNIVAVSLLFRNINLKSLGCLLEIDATKAESAVAKMITEGRLVGILDQEKDLVDFKDDKLRLQDWDTDIYTFCCQVNSTVESIKAFTKSLKV